MNEICTQRTSVVNDFIHDVVINIGNLSGIKTILLCVIKIFNESQPPLSYHLHSLSFIKSKIYKNQNFFTFTILCVAGEEVMKFLHKFMHLTHRSERITQSLQSIDIHLQILLQILCISIRIFTNSKHFHNHFKKKKFTPFKKFHKLSQQSHTKISTTFHKKFAQKK